MPKNKGKGGKNRRRGKNEKDELKRELTEKDGDQQVYAQVQKMLGNARLTAFCFDGKVRMCLIRGKLRKKMWIGTGDIVLIGLRDYQDDKGDVILKYTAEEARLLKAQGHLPDSARLNELCEEQNEGDVEFVDDAEGGPDDYAGAQSREYQLFSSSEESDSNEEASKESEKEEAHSETDDEETKNPSQDLSSADDVSEEGEENSELIAQRAERQKPGARDRRGKGKRGK